MLGTFSAALVLALVPAPAGHGTTASAAEVRALAQAAAHDPGALARLRRIAVVDGRPIAVGHALDGVRGSELAARLRALAVGGATPGPPASTAREQARDILSARRFRGSSVPRPLHRTLAWIGRQVARPFRRLAPHVPGGSSVLWLVLGFSVVALAAFVVAKLARRAGGVRVERTTAARTPERQDPAELERAADTAERSGELGLALRLRFRAGLLRLARERAIPSRASIRTGEVQRILGSQDFDELARVFDEVVYGGRPARSDDLERARDSWPRVVAAGRRR